MITGVTWTALNINRVHEHRNTSLDAIGPSFCMVLQFAAHVPRFDCRQFGSSHLACLDRGFEQCNDCHHIVAN